MRQLIKDNLVIVSYFLTIVCVLIIFYAVNGFNKNQRRDGLPNLIISIVSYATTTLSLIIALLFLVDD
jgi:uncharacterized membrane protein YidH (DUF202 family)